MTRTEMSHLEKLSISMLVLGMRAQQSYVQRFAALSDAGSALLPRRPAATYLAAVSTAGDELIRRLRPLTALSQSDVDGDRA